MVAGASRGKVKVVDIPSFQIVSESTAAGRIREYLKGRDRTPTFAICQALKITRQTANQCLRNMAERGELDVWRNVIVSDGVSKFKSNLYRLKQ